tara:strand:- start:1710 stop:3566 length:1857 start_codon:yes stop_codon:yes gene_type:complete
MANQSTIGNSLAKSLLSNRKSQENPILQNIKSGIYKAITVGGKPDPEGRGRIAAYVPKLGGDPDEPMYFMYASSFGGSNSQGSYGMFSVPPDGGVTILVFFADNGNLNEGYWFAVAQEVPGTVPGGAAGTANPDGSGMGEGIAKDVKVAKSTPNTLAELQNTDEADQGNSNRNVNSASQGIFADNKRGQSTASPLRDANYETTQHSKVYGWTTPGGNGITMDDGSVGDDGTIHPNQIRISTGSGAQVIVDGTNDFVYAINSSGSGWVEIGADGEVMVYAEGSLSMRTEKDFNLRADKNINLEAGENINLHAINNYNINVDNQMHTKTIGSQFYESGGSLHQKVETSMYVSTVNGKLHLNGPMASIAYDIPLETQPDIQNLENTVIEKSIIPKFPTHEPFLRGTETVQKAADGSTPGENNNETQKAGNEIASDPNSASGQMDAANQDSNETSNEDVPGLPPGEGLASIRASNGVGCQVAAIFQSNFQGLIDDLEATGYVIKTLGGYCNRNQRGGSRPSFHAMGAAIDINAYAPNGYARTRPAGWNPGVTRGADQGCDFPLNIGEIAARHGLGWGGNWSAPWDPMHFSAASAERGAYRLTRSYSVADSSSVTGTTAVRLA